VSLLRFSCAASIAIEVRQSGKGAPWFKNRIDENLLLQKEKEMVGSNCSSGTGNILVNARRPACCPIACCDLMTVLIMLQASL
jgi:hypothetical protein